MAEQSQNPGAVTNTFTKGMVKDMNDTFVGEGLWTHARNAVNNSHDGQLGVIGNEPANLHCVTLPYPMIGCIHLTDDQWAVFTTNDVDSEIGIFDESACTYVKKVNDSCLGFKRSNLITGVSRRRYDCALPVYWADGLNPDRFMDLDNPPYKYTDQIINGCINRTYTNRLDCEKIRLASLIDQPCLTISKGKSAGTLPNGSYQVCIAYTINGIKITDYIGLSNVQSVFSHENLNSSLELKISSIDKDFDEFELVIISTVNQQTVAKRFGIYSTSQGIIYIDTINPELISVPISQIPLRTEPIEKSNAMYSVNGYLLRLGSYSKYQFNYQPQANKIISKWVAVQYPDNYYAKGGNKVGYLRDEQYSFFIRWVYNTGEKSASFHIPGRASIPTDTEYVFGGDAFETQDGQEVRRWQVENTGIIDNNIQTTLSDGGLVVATGQMAYWESTELYPADRPDIWGTLCGKPIRHHKMPDYTVNSLLNHFGTGTITVLGVQFENITVPLDKNGNPITSIIGYEILRGSREGNKSIVAKGMFNNMREYTIPGNTTIKGLYQNYPYNDLRPDQLLTSNEEIIKKGNSGENMSDPLTNYKKNIFSFHSPDTTFTKPFLSFNEVKVYQELSGTARGKFITPYKHPKFKVLTNFTSQFSSILGVITTIGRFLATIAQDAHITLEGTEDLPYAKKLTLTKVPNFAIGGGGSVLGTGGNVSIPNPVIAGYNFAIGAYNGAVAVAMSFIEAQSTGEQLFNIVRALVPRRQYALQYNSHGFYDQSRINRTGNIRRKVLDSNYIGGNIHSFDTTYSINNLYRSNYVAIKLANEILDPLNPDTSRFTIGDIGNKKDTEVNSTISGYYGSLKVSIPAQYGQLESIKQVIISNCTFPAQGNGVKHKTDILYGGDTYVGRFTEKNAFPFFNSWLMGEPDEFEYDYREYINVAYPRFWLDSTKLNYALFKNASVNRHLDERDSALFFVSRGYFYLLFNGVRDFYVESEINIAQRDWEDDLSKRHYDQFEFTDYDSLFRSDIAKSGNYYKYDYSLSTSKLFNNYASWGNVYPRDYNPIIADTCYVYRPKRVLYSLPQDQELKKDNWRIFLTNNYKDFGNTVVMVKPVNKTGALFMMQNQSPVQFTGVDALQTDIGTKITIGDGGLFQQPLQSIVNADESYEYGSCQNRMSVVGTPFGIFWVSQNQGKVFQFAGQLREISKDGMKYWFAKYLPSEILKDYPTYNLGDNPVIGIGVQMIYDNTNEIIYITKKDYRPKRKDLLHDEKGFYLPKSIASIDKSYISFSNTNFFEDASWTISYDPKSQTWLSFHDWIPTFLIPGKAHFMSVDQNSIWKHNVRCDKYTNFYGIDYPFEVEFVSSTGQQVVSMRNIEYLLEAYHTHNDCRDKFHILDANFDQAIVYNSEQISGLLELELKSKVNPLDMLNYPQIRTQSIGINYSKEENKYRFNQFWDITKERGEFISTNIPMFNTEANGYKFEINLGYVNYDKPILQRKKFRHHVNRVFLRKVKSNDVKYLFKMSNQKIQLSPR